MSGALVQYSPRIPAGSACEGCGRNKQLGRDHCHDHGWVRGILCPGCNNYLARIDRRLLPQAGPGLLVKLLALRNRCPECRPLEATDLSAQPPRIAPGSPVVQVRVPEDTLARIDVARRDDTRSAWMLRLIDRELAVPSAETVTVASGEPSPGVACATPGCGQRDTSRYGLRRLPLCPECRASLEGREYIRPLPEGAERLVKRGAA